MQHSAQSKLYLFFVEPWLWRLEDLAARLGLTIIIKEQLTTWYMRFKNPITKQISFLEAFDKWLEDGANIVVAMDKMAASARVKGEKNSFHERAAISIGSTLKSGGAIADGMRGLFDQEIIDLFRVGEKNNTISMLMNEYLANYEANKVIKSSFWSGMRYPMFISIAMLMALVLIAAIGVPELDKMGMAVDKLPKDTAVLINIGMHLYTYLSFYLNGAYLAYLITQFAKARYVGRLRPFLDKHIFVFSVHKSMVANNAIKKIALLSRSGIALSETISILLRYSTKYERHFFAQIKHKLSNETGTVADYLDVSLLDEEVFARLSALSSLEGEEAKYNAIYVAGERSGEIAQESIKRASKLIVWFMWLTTITLSFYFVLGAIDFTMNLDKTIKIV